MQKLEPEVQPEAQFEVRLVLEETGATKSSGVEAGIEVAGCDFSSATVTQGDAISEHADDSESMASEAGPKAEAETINLISRKSTKDRPASLAEPSISEDNTAADEMNSSDTTNEDNVDAEPVRLDEHDSLVTVRLSELPILSINTSSRSSLGSTGMMLENIRPATPTKSQRGTMPTVAEDEVNTDDSSDESEEVNWDQLQQTENEESNGQTTDNTALLLARLEQENAKLATNPKSIRVQAPDKTQASPRRVRPLSVAQLRNMVEGPTPSALRYSMLPPTPMTDLEFYAALVQDYHQTAARLPTLLSNKIRKGIPPPLRGVVWQGMSGATRDMALGDQYDRFCDASSPYEGIIGKDLGRSFPGVEMFREPDGDGQRMLGSVLKSYSLHEPRIGYCQGLAFLVGPLLMHMPDKEAFCVLVKLMENYDLRSSYMPDLAGLHVRIYQFRELLRSTLPELSSHLELLQVDPAAYVSQWFLSIFAVTCPLPMLFRMYDVAFAEGAAETIMRVALSLMQKNQSRLLACAELEDAIQLLLSRGLWDCYHYNADEFVLHFLSLSNVVTRDRLALLDQAYREAQITSINPSDPDETTDRSSAISTIASRFLGRLWAASSSSVSPALSAAVVQTPPAIHESPSPSIFASSPKSQPLGFNAGLGASPLRPLSLLQRSSSKNSIASTLNSVEAAYPAASTSSSATSSSSSSVLSSTSSDATSVSRDSSSEIKGASKVVTVSSSGVSNNKFADNDRYLHSQIEDLLTAFSDLQRQHALLADQLQQEREERSDDKRIVQTLLQGLRQESTRKAAAVVSEETSRIIGVQLPVSETDNLARASQTAAEVCCDSEMSIPETRLQALLEPVEDRFSSIDNRRSSVPQTKSQLRDELVRAKEQLANELAKGQDRHRQVCEMEQEVTTMKDQLRECHAHARVLHKDKQRLERQVCELRTRVVNDTVIASVATSGAAPVASNSADPANSSTAVSAGTGAHSFADAATEWLGRATGVGGGASGKKLASGGLRELKLVRSNSTPTETFTSSTASNLPQAVNTMYTSGGYGKRSSSLIFRGPGRRESDQGGSGIGTTMSSYPTANEIIVEQEQEALVLELVQAKTSEAVARQEAEEAKQKLESLRKALGLSAADLNSMLYNASASAAGSTGNFNGMGMLGRLTTSISDGGNVAASTTAVEKAPTGTSVKDAAPLTGYGFFGWRR
ncbi:hypothetical protein SEPCBS57363_002446 [Sporothrix epigloea]|uniref:Rab-GAP TBC domain-containing protein n=1 Tax=Sporothrix epigloea TaxID=1892477 RepID=A0ABP0DJ57_9PEZI